MTNFEKKYIKQHTFLCVDCGKIVVGVYTIKNKTYKCIVNTETGVTSDHRLVHPEIYQQASFEMYIPHLANYGATRHYG